MQNTNYVVDISYEKTLKGPRLAGVARSIFTSFPGEARLHDDAFEIPIIAKALD
jgi:hypothetical protein